MGKTKKLKKFGDTVARPLPLAEQIIHESEASPTLRVKYKNNKDEDPLKFVDGTLGQNILKQSLAQLQELSKEEFPPLGVEVKSRRERDIDIALVKHGEKKTFKKTKINNREEDSDDDLFDECEDATPLNVEKTIQDFENELQLDSEDLSILDHFKNKDSLPQRRLADFFKERITEKQTEIQSQIDSSSVIESTLKPETIAQCKQIGEVLQRYRSGPLPKMLKTFPIMSCWEELLFHTDPDKWTAASMYQITRLFVSNLQAHMAQHFCTYVLLPRIRDDISCYKRLNFHLYQALTKALYKPAAFFKGIILPLCTAGDCTLREAIIIGSVMACNHIPIIHSAAAVLKIISMDYYGANFIFLRVLFDKKYALPYKVIEECVINFMRFKNEGETLPVLWHQTLLTFIQRYKNDLGISQKKELLSLVNFQSHYKITPEIRRELDVSSNAELMDER